MSDNEELIWTICVCYNNGMACSLFWEEKDFTGHIRRTFWAWCRQRYWQFLFHIAKRLLLSSSIYSIGWMELKVSETGHENCLQISRKSGIMAFKISPNSYCQIVLYRVYRLLLIIKTFCQYGFQNTRCQPKMSIRWWFRLHGYFDAV